LTVGITQYYIRLTTDVHLGKTNQHGRIEYGSALRHYNHKACLIGSLGLYFFYRFHVSGETFPSFRTSKDWYNVKVLKRDEQHVTTELSNSTASSWAYRLNTAAEIKGSKTTHHRGSAARVAEANRVPEAQV
jgi:hypothetical protein